MYPRSGLPAFLGGVPGLLDRGRVTTCRRRKRRRLAGGHRRPTAGTRRAGPRSSSSGEARVTNPNGAAESAIAINPVDPDMVIAGSNGPGGGQKMHYSSDGGETWSTVASRFPAAAATRPSPGRPTAPSPTPRRSASRAVLLPLHRRRPDLDRPGADRQRSGFVDKQYLHVDTHPTSPHLDNLYHTWHESNDPEVLPLHRHGLTWSAELTSVGRRRERHRQRHHHRRGGQRVPLLARDQPARHPGAQVDRRRRVVRPDGRSGRHRGRLRLPIPVMDTRPSSSTSRPTPTAPAVPSTAHLRRLDRQHRARLGYAANNHARIQVAYSTDGGATWNVTTPHETADELTVDRFHQWLARGARRLGARDLLRHPPRSAESEHGRRLPLRVDRRRRHLEPAGARHRPSSRRNITDGFEWGDYNGLDAVGSDLIAIYTDNRDEVGGDPLSVDVYAAGFESGGRLHRRLRVGRYQRLDHHRSMRSISVAAGLTPRRDAPTDSLQTDYGAEPFLCV